MSRESTQQSVRTSEHCEIAPSLARSPGRCSLDSLFQERERAGTRGGMFQPQPPPFSPFSSYGIASPIPPFPGFQPAAGVVDSGGPTTFRDPIFSPVASNNINANGHLPFNHNNSHGAQPYKMASNDMEAQEALARDFQPALEVCWSSKVRCDQG